MPSTGPTWRRPLLLTAFMWVAILGAWWFGRHEPLPSRAPPPPPVAAPSLAPVVTKPLRGVVRDRRSTPQAGITVAIYAVPLAEVQPSLCGSDSPVRLFEESCAAAHAEVQRLIDTNALAAKPLLGVETDAEGRFEVELPPGKYDVVAIGGTRGFGVVFDATQDSEPIDLRLGQDVARGSVRTVDGYALPEVKVAVVLPRPRLVWMAETSPSGEFVAGPVPGSRELVAWTKVEGYGPTIDRGESGEALELLAVRQMRVHGVVTFNKTPVEGATVALNEVEVATTDARGTYVIEKAECVDTCNLLVQKGDWIGGALVPESTTGRRVDIEMVATRPVQISVVDALTRQPVEGDVRVFLSSSSDERIPLRLIRMLVEASGPGVYTARGLFEGDYEVLLQARGYTRAMETLHIAPDKGDVTYEVSKAVGVSGQVVSVSGEPVAGAAIQFSELEPTATSDEQGRFAIDYEHPGDFSLKVSATGYFSERVSSEAPPAEPLRITLRRSPRIPVRVTDEAGKPIASARVTCLPGGDAPPTGADGSTQCEVFREGGNEVVAAADGYVTSPRIPFELKRAALQPLEIRLQPGLSLRGQVVDERGRGSSGVSLQAIHEDEEKAEELQFSGTSGSNGEFQLSGLAPGRYRLTVEGRARRESEAPGLLVNAGDVDVRVVVPRPSILRGTVKRDGVPVTRLTINEEPVLAREGRFVFELAPEGDDELTLRGDFVPVTLTVTHKPGSETDLGVIDVTPLGAIEGRIANVAAEGRIFIGPATGASRLIAAGHFNVDERGRFHVPHRAPGRYVVAVNTDRGEVVRECEVRAGRTTTFDFAVPRGATLVDSDRPVHKHDHILEAAGR